jgi:hypothetical protein
MRDLTFGRSAAWRSRGGFSGDAIDPVAKSLTRGRMAPANYRPGVGKGATAASGRPNSPLEALVGKPSSRRIRLLLGERGSQTLAATTITRVKRTIIAS